MALNIESGQLDRQPTDEQLTYLSYITGMWLGEHGHDRIFKGVEIYGEYGGIPICEEPPRQITRDISKEAIDSVIPGKTDALKLGKGLQIGYYYPYYTPDQVTDGSAYSGSHVDFILRHTDWYKDNDDEEILALTQPSSETMEAMIIEGMPPIPTHLCTEQQKFWFSFQSDRNIIVEHAGMDYFNRFYGIGANVVSQSEILALTAVVENASLLVAFDRNS